MQTKTYDNSETSFHFLIVRVCACVCVYTCVRACVCVLIYIKLPTPVYKTNKSLSKPVESKVRNQKACLI